MLYGRGFLTIKVGQVCGRRGVAEASQETGDLSAMVRPVVDHVEDQLPEGLLQGSAFEIDEGNWRDRPFVVEIGGPILPAFQQLWPSGL
jgi:hypothetical protein